MSRVKSHSRVKLGIIFSFLLLFMAFFSCVLLFSIFTKNNDELKDSQTVSEISQEDHISVSLVSPFGTNEYRCTGTCVCETSDISNRRSLSGAGVIKHSTLYLVSAVSSFVAYKLFQDYMSEECYDQFDDCPSYSIESHVDDCEEFLYTESSSLENKASKESKPREKPRLVLDEFCERQFREDYDGTRIPMKKEEFMEELLQTIEDLEPELRDGYAPFCKHYFVPNFANCDAGYVKLDEETSGLVETKYHARREDELPVLVRYIRKENLKEVPKGKYLDIILYSKEQIERENEAMGHDTDSEEEEAKGDYDYGVISVMCVFQDCEIPMNPITCMRNALGTEFGGSGKEIDRDDYMKSVDFWKDNISIGD